MRKLFILPAFCLFLFLFQHTESKAQQYKLRQVSTMMGMKTETTIYVKKMRKRTEGGAMPGMPTANIVTIEQCDLQRTVKLNDKKKLYYIEPYSKQTEEVIDEDVKPAVAKTKPAVTPTSNQKGGTITMWYSINDTGERKKVWNFTARHVWTYQKMKPSPDACTMKDSIIIKTDGWYIDLPEYNCPIPYKPSTGSMPPQQKPDCVDKFVTRRSGKGKLGFPITEKRTIIMGNQGPQASEFTTDIETMELTNLPLDSTLFIIPAGYTETKNEADLQDKMDANAMMKMYSNIDPDQMKEAMLGNPNANPNEKKPGILRIGVYAPKGDQVQPLPLQDWLVMNLRNDKVEAIAVATEEEARQKNCDYSLSTDFTKIKQASKVGGLLKAIKNTDPNAASSFNIEAGMVLTLLADNSIKLQPAMSGKYEGKIDDAEKKVVEEGARQVLKGLK